MMAVPRWFFKAMGAPKVGSLLGSFCLIAVIVTTCCTVLALPLLNDAWRIYRSNLQAIDTLALWERGLDAGRMLGAERGPTNGLLDNPLADQAVWRTRLGHARARTDDTLARFEASLVAHSQVEHHEAAAQVSTLRARLTAQRDSIDALAALPRENRSPHVIEQAIDGMIALAHPLMSINLSLGQSIGRDGSKLRLTVLVTQLSADLREYAGQIGSRLIAGLSYGPVLGADHLGVVDRIEGRILQIHDVIEGRLSGQPQDAELVKARADLRRDYLQDGLAYIRAVRSNGLTPNGSGRISGGAITEHYVPQMRSIEAMRDLMLARAKAVAARDCERASAWLVAGVGIVIGVFAILGLVSLLAHRHLIEPLIATTREVNDLAADQFQTTTLPRRYFGEIRAMIEAIAVLRARNLRRLQLEEEREELLREIRQIAETDHLTGLANRRTFELVGRKALESQKAVALVLCDIDHFKAINDRYGHPAGDAVIREVARRLQETVRGGDIVCRYGGEEFALIVTGVDAEWAEGLAERLRMRVASSPIHVAELDIGVTVSFGLACAARPEAGIGLPQLVERADAALYRAKKAGRNQVWGPWRDRMVDINAA